MPHETINQNSESKSTSSLKKALIASEIRYRRLFESAKDGILILDAETGMIVDVNPFLINLLGYTKENFIKKSVWEIGFLKDIIQNKVKFLELQQKEYVRYEDLPLETTNGKTIHVEFVSNVYLEGDQKVIQCNIRDITERKLSENLIINGHKMLRTLIDNLPALIYIKDLKCRKIIANIADVNNAGYQKEDEILGKTDIELFPGDIGQRGYADDQMVISSEKAIIDRIEDFINSEGKRRWMSTSKIPLRNSEGEITGLVGIGYDITESKKIEMELIESKNKAEESDRLKSAFLANMSHEIRTPMNGILGFTDLLREPNLNGEEQNKYIEVISKSGERLLKTINNLLDISRIEAGEVKIRIEDCDVKSHLENLYSFFKPEVEKKRMNLIFKNELSEEKILLKTDPDKFDSILTNLIKNAIKYSHSGSIEFGYQLKNEEEPAELEFYVKDAGIGIQKNRLNAIFNRFVQADIEDRAVYQGNGLGLSITKSYVEMLGGKIWVVSKVGYGSTFFFTIPFSNELYNKIPLKKPNLKIKENHSLNKLKILLAEDDDASAELMKIALTNSAKEIIMVKNGNEAIEACIKNPDIDLVLMDIQMPELNGYNATKKIREFNKKVLIIAQTAFALNTDREKAIEAGCNDYISKPVKIKALTEIIEGHIFKLRRVED